MILLCTIQTMLSLFLFHKLYNKPNCKCFKHRIIDTCLIILALIPAGLFFVNIHIPVYATLGIIISTIMSIRFLSQYNYNIEKLNW